MRKKVSVICLNRMGVKVGEMTIISQSDESDAKQLFECNKATIKRMFPSAVKLKLQSKK